MAESINREEAPHVGEPDDASIAELAGVAPPCEECGEREATARVDGRDLCDECRPDSEK